MTDDEARLIVIGMGLAFAWALLILGCWLHWIAIGRRQGGSLNPTSWWALFTMPVWTLQCHREVGRKQKQARLAHRQNTEQLIVKLRELERRAPPGAPLELRTRLRSGIDHLQASLKQEHRNARIAGLKGKG